MKAKLLLLAAIIISLSGCLQVPEHEVVYPIDNFHERITLKPFGLYVTPLDSPVDPERFQGFHSGTDHEAPEEEDVWVRSIADGTTRVAASFVNGYGGVIIIEHEIDGEKYMGLYGHVDLDTSTVKVGDTVKAGENIALIGDAYSADTDNERKHLHFSIKKGTDIEYRGYVQSESELGIWIDPEEFFAERK